MILRQHIRFHHLFSAFGKSALRKTWPRIGIVTTVAAVLAWTRVDVARYGLGLTATPFSLLGVALGIFLAFRTNASYDRFWEARRFWGRLVNVTRTFARQLQLFVRAPEAQTAEAEAFRRAMTLRTIAYVESFRALMRDEGPGRLEPFVSAEEAAEAAARRVPPLAILQRLGDGLGYASRRGWIHQLHLPALDASLVEVASIQGGCERIKNTPVPFSYSLLIHRITAFYCVLLPFGLVDSAGAATPLATALIAYAFFGLDSIGEEVENPFEREPNDLPLDALTRVIEIDLRQMIGDRDIPAPLGPVDDVLL